MLKRKNIRLVLGAMALLLALPFAANAQKVTVDFWFGENVESYIETMQQIVDDFNNSHPTVYVNMSLQGTIQGDKLEQLKVSIAGGVPPDLAYLDGTAIFELGLGSGMFIPLNELAEPGYLESLSFLPVPNDEFQYNGVWYGIPFRTDSRGIYLNEDHFAQAGFDPHAGFPTLAALDEAAAKLTTFDSEGNIARVGFVPRGNNFGGETPWIWIFGGEMYDWVNHRPQLTGNPNNVRALEWILDYADRYGPNTSTGQTRFLAGTASMTINSTTRLRQYEELAPELNWWVAQIPAAEGGMQTTLSTVLGAAIPLGAKNPEGAMEFIKYLAEPDVQLLWYRRTQSVPTQLDAFREALADMDDPRERNMVTLLPVAKGYPPLFAYYTRPIFEQQVQAMRRREITPEQVLENTERISWPRYVEVFGGE